MENLTLTSQDFATPIVAKRLDATLRAGKLWNTLKIIFEKRPQYLVRGLSQTIAKTGWPFGCRTTDAERRNVILGDAP